MKGNYLSQSFCSVSTFQERAHTKKNISLQTSNSRSIKNVYHMESIPFTQPNHTGKWITDVRRLMLYLFLCLLLSLRSLFICSTHQYWHQMNRFRHMARMCKRFVGIRNNVQLPPRIRCTEYFFIPFRILLLLDNLVFCCVLPYFCGRRGLILNRAKEKTLSRKKLREPFLMCHLIFPFFRVFLFCLMFCSNVSFSLVLPFISNENFPICLVEEI